MTIYIEDVRPLVFPGAGSRGVHVPGVVIVLAQPAEDAKPEIANVHLDSRMHDDFNLPRCHHQDDFQFTIPGWRKFIEAAKAGKFDHLLDGIE